MTSSEYIQNALRTEPTNYSSETYCGVTPRIEHGVFGLVSEAGELMERLKHSKIYRKQFDTINMVEEIGDFMWYLAILSDELGISFEDVWEKNINKLRARYPEKYNEHNALNRDLNKERKVLEA